MASFPLILIFFSGLFLFFAFGYWMGHIFNLGNYYFNNQSSEDTDYEYLINE